MKILISGGAGFIGSNLTSKLIKHGHTVRILDNFSKQIHGDDYRLSPLYANIAEKAEIVHGDVRSKEDWQRSLENMDAIIHLAAETGTGQSMYEIERYTNVNVSGTAVLLHILANEEHCVKKMVVASSRAVYGEGKYSCDKHGAIYPPPRHESDMAQKDFHVKCPFCGVNAKLLPTTEDATIHPTSVYGFTKKAQEELCMIIGKSIGVPAVALRYQNVYGPGQSLKNPYTGILSIFSTRILNNNPINIFEDGLESRDFIYIDDAVEATYLALVTKNADFQAINVGSGVSVSVLQVANYLKKLYDSDTMIHFSGNYRLGDIRHNVADISKLVNCLGFRPKFDFYAGLNLFADWVKSQKIEDDNFEQSIEEMRQKGLYK